MTDIKTILNSLTLEEKASLASGQNFWTTKSIKEKGVPSVTMTDGPHGLRKELGLDNEKGSLNIMKGSELATCFPPAVTVASSWDRVLVGEMASAIAEEAKHYNVSTVLGPGTNIKRSPLCGRNFEYFSEDPYLAGQMSLNYVGGMQREGVGVSLKHFCANNEEFCRMSIDSRIDERALREIYLPAFETTVKGAHPQQIMCSYNRLNGEYLSENKRLLTDILRKEWGFDGMVVSDWGAVNERVKGVKAGLDLQMPGNKGMNDREIVKAVNDGTLTMEELDETTYRVIRYVFDCVEKRKDGDRNVDFEANYNLAKKIGEKSAVLLKNEDNILPLAPTENVALIGKLAKESRYQGSGSSRICCQKLVNILDTFKAKNPKYTYCEGYTLSGDGYNQKLIDKAVAVAKNADKVVLVIGLTDIYESEGFDRTHLDIPCGHTALLDALFEVNKNIVVVLEGGAPIITPWANKVKAILNTYLQGEAVGDSTYALLYGEVNPCGKLAETFPLALDDVLAQKYFPMGPRTVEYRESIFVGYRYFDKAEKEVAYPFGYGLSYTTFEYSNLSVSESYTEGQKLKITFDITNTGKVDGEEIAQVYVGQNNPQVFKAVKELKGFEKVLVKAGKTKKVTVVLDTRAFAFYNTAIADWTVLEGDYNIMVGASSRDIHLQKTIKVTSLTPDTPLPEYSEKVKNVYDNLNKIEDIDKQTFEELYGEKLPENTPYKVGEFHINSTLGELDITPLGKFINRIAKVIAKFVAGDSANAAMIINSVKSMPLRALSGFSGGIFSTYSVKGLVKVFNKEKGGWRMFCKGFLKKNK